MIQINYVGCMYVYVYICIDLMWVVDVHGQGWGAVDCNFPQEKCFECIQKVSYVYYE